MARPTHKGDPKTKRGKRLIERMVQDPALKQATEEGYKALEEGRVSKLEDVKRRLGDV